MPTRRWPSPPPCAPGSPRPEPAAAFPPPFAGELVDGWIAERRACRAQPGRGDGVPLRRRRLGTGFLVATTRALVDRELAAAGDAPEYGGRCGGAHRV